MDLKFKLKEMDPQVKELTLDYDEEGSVGIETLKLYVEADDYYSWLQDQLNTDYEYRLGYELKFPIETHCFTNTAGIEITADIVVEDIKLDEEGNLTLECGICSINGVIEL